jgi:hypothetical protein
MKAIRPTDERIFDMTRSIIHQLFIASRRAPLALDRSVATLISIFIPAQSGIRNKMARQ